MTRRDWMHEALALAKQAQLAGEVPVGAVVVHDGNIVALAELEQTVVDMFTTVFVGNAATQNLRGKMVTPRGYRGV